VAHLLDRIAAVLIAAVSLLPGVMVVGMARLLGVAAIKGRCSELCFVMGIGTWFIFVLIVSGLAVAIAVWRRHILGRSIGFGATLAVAAWLIVETVQLDPSLENEIRTHVLVAGVLACASALLAISLASSGRRRLRARS
jgi:hypothetical protein